MSSASTIQPGPDTPHLSPEAGGGQAMWGGRFSTAPADALQAINASIGFDQALWAEDIAGSIAHATMLGEQGMLSREDMAAIIDGLKAIGADIAAGRFAFDPALEDIHMNVEARLAERIGDPARRLHTGRSRNDQVATDFRLWVRAALDRADQQLQGLQAALLQRAEEHAATILPGLTHLQQAQPVTFGFHLLAYVEMLGRDRGRLADARARLNECPLGAGALAGTPYPIDRTRTAGLLGFDRPTANAMDSVSSRDFALEYLAGVGIAMAHLSRLAEELVLWTSDRFRFVRLPDAWTTGSSIMPQKRNPDAAELVRGKVGRVLGGFVALLSTVKALPLAYAKDLQEDKEPVFDADATLRLALTALTAMVAALEVNRDAMRQAAEGGHPTATDLADWLVMELGIPFRTAHHITGRLVARADQLGVTLVQLPLEELQAAEPRITEAVRAVLTVEASVAARRSFGGTAPEQVRDAVAAARARYLAS